MLTARLTQNRHLEMSTEFNLGNAKWRHSSLTQVEKNQEKKMSANIAVPTTQAGSGMVPIFIAPCEKLRKPWLNVYRVIEIPSECVLLCVQPYQVPNALDPWSSHPSRGQAQNGKAFLWSRYECLWTIDHGGQKLESVASSSWVFTAWDCFPAETS